LQYGIAKHRLLLTVKIIKHPYLLRLKSYKSYVSRKWYRYCLLLGISFTLLYSTPVYAQELYPLSEPASTLPKGVIGVRLFSETYKEVNQWRNMTYLRLMYGLGSKISVYATGIASNHHGKTFPSEFPFHNTPERGAHYPYKFNGIHLYAKYRFWSLDAPKKHWRMAAYAEGTYVNTTHHETESSLDMGDNKGIGAGIIATYLHHKFATSLTTGIILPFSQKGITPDAVASLDPVPLHIAYGNALQYSLSFGYLLLPKAYKSYQQLNLNLYLELKGKAYQTASVDLYVGLPNEYHLSSVRYPSALQKGAYLDISPGIQFIINSDWRVDAAVTFNAIGTSYARLYPVYSIAIQKYFYR
jgi:hypothetical protein